MSRLAAPSIARFLIAGRAAVRVTVLFAAVTLAACSADQTTAPTPSSSTHTPVPTTNPTPAPLPAPTITLTAQSIAAAGGGSCLVFYAKSTEDLTVFTGTLIDPLERSFRVDPAAGQSFVMGQGRLATLQAAGRLTEISPGAVTLASTAFFWPVTPWCPDEF